MSTDNALTLAKSLYDKREYERALDYCTKYLSEHPDHSDALRLTSKILESTDNVDDAIHTVTHLINVSSFKEPCDYFARGRWLLRVGRVEEAVKDFRSIISISKKENDIYYIDVARIFLTYALARLMEKEEAKIHLSLLDEDFLLYINQERIDRGYLERMLR